MIRNMTNGKPWARATTQRVADQMKRLRGERTVQWLADRTEELGYPISRSRISDLERGDRGSHLGAAELLVLARALNASPAVLLFPGIPGQPVELFPDVQVESRLAAEWLNGETALLKKFAWREGSSDHESASLVRWQEERQAEWQRNNEPIRLASEHKRLLQELGRQMDERDRWLQDPSRPQARDLAATLDGFIRETEQSLRALRRQIRALGLVPPALPAGMDQYFDKDNDDA